MYEDICKSNKVMQYCIERKKPKTPKHITKHANTIKLVPVQNNMQHSVLYAFSFLLQLKFILFYEFVEENFRIFHFALPGTGT